MLPGGRFDDAADIEDHHHPFPPGTVGFLQIHQQFPFGAGEFEIPIQAAVLALAGLAAENDHGHIVYRGLVGDGRCRQGQLLAVLAILLEFLVETLLQGLRSQAVVALQPLVQGKAGRLHRLGHRDHIRLGHLAGTGPAGNEVLAGNSVQGNSFRAFQRKRMALITKQDDGLRRRFPGRDCVRLQVRMAGIGVLPEPRRLDHILQNPADVAVHFFHRQSAILHTLENALDFHIGTRVHQVVAGLDGQDGIVLEPPVRNYDAVIAPVIPEDGGQEFIILLGILAVQFVVRAHHRPRTAFFDGNLEILQIDLPQGPAAHLGVVFSPVGLLIIDRVVLDGCAHAVALDTPHIGRRHLAGEERILREILEVPAIQRIAMDVHSRSQEHVHAVLQHFVAQNGRGLLHQIDIPGTGQERSHRESGRHRVRRIPLRVDPDAGRAVGEHRLRNAQPRNGPGTARQTGHHVVGTSSHEQGRFLFQGQCLQDLVDIIRPKPRLRRRRYSHQQREGRAKGRRMEKVVNE